MTENKIRQDSIEKQAIVVFDDDRLSSHNLSIQLRFVGENPVLSTSDNWKDLFTSLRENKELDNIFAIALGVIKSCPLLDLINTLHGEFPALPLLLLNNQEEIQYSLLPDSLQAKFLPLGDKSLNYRSLLIALQNARQMTGREPRILHSNIISDTGTAMFRSLGGQSEPMQKVRQLLHGVATRDVTALVIGESGTGKEIVARNLHYHSGRAERPFIVVNCASVAPDRQGAELFGHEKNFQGAVESVSGLIEKAHGGSLFFDDIADLPLNVQGMLLRFLEDKKFQRAGGHTIIATDVRVVAATRHSLEEKIRQGSFRQDLYYRLSVVPIEIPPLRARVEDIADLIKELLSRLENKEHSSIRFNSAAIQSLQQHSWPGNVRELANLVERMCIIKPNEVIGLSDLPQEYQYTDERRTNSDRRKSSGESKADANGAHATDTAASPSSPEPTPAQTSQQSTDSGSVTRSKTTDVPVMAESGALQARQTTAAANRGSEHIQRAVDSPVLTLKQIEAGMTMAPLNAERLEQYLENLERNMLEVAMHDSANIVKFAAHRLKIDEAALQDKLQKHGLNVK